MFKKYAHKRKFKRNVTTQPRPQSSLKKKQRKKHFFHLPSLAKRCACNELGDNWQSNKKLLF